MNPTETEPKKKKPGRPPRIRQEQLAVKSAEELLQDKNLKLKPAMRTRLIEILIRHADMQADVQEKRAQRRYEKEDQMVVIAKLRAENADLRRKLENAPDAPKPKEFDAVASARAFLDGLKKKGIQ